MIVLLAGEADVFGLFNEAKTLEAYKKQLEGLDPKAIGTLVIIMKAYEKVIQKITVHSIDNLKAKS